MDQANMPAAAPATNIAPFVTEGLMPLARLGEIGTRLIEQAARAVIVTDEDGERATSLQAMIQKLMKDTETTRKQSIEAADSAVKAINAPYRALYKTLEEAKEKLSGEITRHLRAKREEEERRRAAVAKQRADDALAAATALAEQGHTVAADSVLDTAAKVERVASAPVKTQASGVMGGTSFLRRTWTFRVTDFTAMPDVFKTVDETAIRQFIRDVRREAEREHAELKGAEFEAAVVRSCEAAFESIRGVKFDAEDKAVTRS